jgi:molybdopterin-guanine dinucleotide biosynthesis protein A
MNFSTVILAGGKSSRMGRDKAFLQIDGETLLARQIRIARESGAAEILISGRPDRDYSAFDCQVLLDQFPDAGPLGGIHSALLAVQNPLLFVLAVDMPYLTSDLLKRLIKETQAGLGVVPHFEDKIEPLAAFYPRAALSLCKTFLYETNRAAGNFAAGCVRNGLAKFFDLPAVDKACFASWNTPEDSNPARESQPHIGRNFQGRS